MSGAGSIYFRVLRIVRQFPPLDWPVVVWTRLTTCRRHGHRLGLDFDYCTNCGKPWSRA